MTTVLVLSDSHGRSDLVRRVLDEHRDIEHVWFLGDGEKDFLRTASAYSIPDIRTVHGNCDMANYICSDGGNEQIFDFCTHKMLLTHGHSYRVKSVGTDRLRYRALESGADIVLFGHTHRQQYIYESEPSPIHFFNPGSLMQCCDGHRRFGILTFDDSGAVLFSHGELCPDTVRK